MVLDVRAHIIVILPSLSYIAENVIFRKTN